jgi:hypothetical protein
MPVYADFLRCLATLNGGFDTLAGWLSMLVAVSLFCLGKHFFYSGCLLAALACWVFTLNIMAMRAVFASSPA